MYSYLKEVYAVVGKVARYLEVSDDSLVLAHVIQFAV